MVNMCSRIDAKYVQLIDPGRCSSNSRSVISENTLRIEHLGTPLRNCSDVHIIETHWRQANIGSGNGLVPSVLTNIADALWCN